MLQNYMQRTSNLFVEHLYFKFQGEIHFFQYNNETSKRRYSDSFCGCNRPALDTSLC